MILDEDSDIPTAHVPKWVPNPEDVGDEHRHRAADIGARGFDDVAGDHSAALSDRRDDLECFRPLHPHLSPSPEGLEPNDVYALTVRENAGLDLHHLELVPPESAH